MTQVTMCPETEQEAQSVSHGADLIVRLRRLLFSRLLRLLRRILLPVLVSCVPFVAAHVLPAGNHRAVDAGGGVGGCSSRAHCKDEASEHSGFERHGVADTTKKNAPEWFEETLPKTAMGEHKDAGK